ncbi:RNA-binding protein 34-like isoform X1 [Lycorma delicatula]|uniref:RNA-binding protein 34-like isoform X1 n=1 Tax=Lycorma delicatula TaxID=130591 RepID=UPI003F51002F
MAPAKKEDKIKVKKKNIKLKNKNKISKKKDKKYFQQSHNINEHKALIQSKHKKDVSFTRNFSENTNSPIKKNKVTSQLLSTIPEIRQVKSNHNDVKTIKQTSVANINPGKPFFSEEERGEINARTIFVGNLPKSVSRKKLKKLFSKYGPVESARLRCSAINISHLPRSIAVSKRDFHPKATSVFGFVKFVNKSSVDESLKANGTVYEEHHLRVDRITSDKTESTQNSVFLGNVPFDVADNDVRKVFEGCGEIESVHIIRDNKTGMGKGFGYVNFKFQDSVEFALKLNGAMLKKRNIRVKRAVKRFAEKRQNERIIEKDKTKQHKNTVDEKLKLTYPKKTKEKKKKDNPVKAFQGHTIKDKSVKKKKSKKKLRKEFSKKRLIEVLSNN